jgi:thioredoxin-like negative regulator of GroEL
MTKRTSSRAERSDAPGRSTEERPLLLFFTERTSGPCRRMQSLIAWLSVTRKDRLRVAEIDVEANPSLVQRLGIARTPTLVLVAGGRPAARIVGRATGKQIDEMLGPFLVR